VIPVPTKGVIPRYLAADQRETLYHESNPPGRERFPRAAEESIEENYVYLCLIFFRSSKNSMNSAKTQHPIKTIAIDVTVQLISLSSIVMPPDDHSIMVRLARTFNNASRITPAL
jgi:hypothetical protein